MEWSKLAMRYPGGVGLNARLPPPLFSSTVHFLDTSEALPRHFCRRSSRRQCTARTSTYTLAQIDDEVNRSVYM